MLSLTVQLRQILWFSLVCHGTLLALMFLLYVNGIVSNCLLYRTIDSAADEIPRQHGRLVKHLAHEFNATRCHLLKITRQGKCIPTKYNISRVQLQEVDHYPYLGVELTSDQTCRTHISNITSKTNRIINLLRRHLCGCTKEVKFRAFTSLAGSHLKYSSLF